MKKYLVAVALAAAAASPAFAATSKHISRVDATQGYAYAAPDASTVVVGGKIVGRDPDPAIRADLMREGDPAQANGQ